MLASHEAGPRRRANRGARVALREAHSFSGHSVEVWCFDFCLAVAPEIAIAKVIRQDENNIRFVNAAFVDRRFRALRLADENQTNKSPPKRLLHFANPHKPVYLKSKDARRPPKTYANPAVSNWISSAGCGLQAATSR